MIVLGFDTATPATAVALRLADGTTLRARDDPGAEERPGHTTRLLPLASELLRQGRLPWGAVQRIAVGVGPGTFTGLRVGIAMARGLAQSLDIDVVGISSLLTLAEAALVDRDTRLAGRSILAAIDARRGEAFVAAYAPGEESSAATPPRACEGSTMASREGPTAATPPRAREGSTMASRGGPTAATPPRACEGSTMASCGGPSAATPPRARELAPPRALAPEALDGFLAGAGADRDWLAVGDGAIRFRIQMEAAGVAVAAEDSSLHRIDAGVLCELALVAPSDATEAVLPDYRRRPDAEIALENAEP